MRDAMNQFYLCDEHYWSRYDGQDIPSEELKINVISDGITRLPVLEGEVSHVEIPRSRLFLGMTIVGGADTPLKCVVVQEIYPGGLIANDGRLQPGDQIVEVNGIDITCAKHSQICSAIRKMMSVLRLGIFRERMEKYGEHGLSPNTPETYPKCCSSSSSSTTETYKNEDEDPLAIDLEHLDNRQLGVCRNINKSAKRVCERDFKIKEVETSREEVKICSRRCNDQTKSEGPYSALQHNIRNGLSSCDPAKLENKNVRQEDFLQQSEQSDHCPVRDVANPEMNQFNCKERPIRSEVPKEVPSDPIPDQTESQSSSAEKLPHSNGFRSHSNRFSSNRTIFQVRKSSSVEFSISESAKEITNGIAMSSMIKRALKPDGFHLPQRTLVFKKVLGETLGMRVGGGIGSSEGDTPIYVANIHPQGCIGKSRQFKKGDILMSVNGIEICGLSHTQAIAALKSAANFDKVTLELIDGPETSQGSSNFTPGWTYWQKLPRYLQFSKTVILNRHPPSSWGFSIVGGSDCGSSRLRDPIHVLYVVPDSPAKDAHLKCGDRILAVDGHSLENVSHQVAVSMLKQTKARVVLEIISWMGTEL